MITFKGKKPDEITIEDVKEMARMELNHLPVNNRAQMESVILTASEIVQLEEFKQEEAVNRVRETMSRVHSSITEKIIETAFLQAR